MYTQNVTHHAKQLLLVALTLAGSGMAGAALAQSATVTATGDISSSCSFTSSGVVTLNIGQVPLGVFTQPSAVSNASAPDFIILTCTANPTTPLVLNAVNTINPGSCNTGCSVSIPVAARYYATSSAVTTGAGNATATLNFTFN